VTIELDRGLKLDKLKWQYSASEVIRHTRAIQIQLLLLLLFLLKPAVDKQQGLVCHRIV